MVQHGKTLKTVGKVKEASHRGLYTVWFLSYEMCKIGIVTRIYSNREYVSGCLRLGEQGGMVRRLQWVCHLFWGRWKCSKTGCGDTRGCTKNHWIAYFK